MSKYQTEIEEKLNRHPYGVPRVQGRNQRIVLLSLGWDLSRTWRQEGLTNKIGCTRGVVCNAVSALEERGYVQKRAGARAKAGKVLPAVQGSELAKEWVTSLLKNVTLSPEQRSYTGIYLNARRILRGLGRRYPAAYTAPELAEELGLGCVTSRNFVKGLDERELVYSCDKKSHVKKYRMTEAGMAWYREDRLLRGLKL